MTLDCTTKGKAKIKMLDSVAKMIEELPEEFDGEAVTPAGNDLLKIDENSQKVDEKRAKFFHTRVAKTLFVCKRARPDLQPTVSFLCKRAKDCREDDHQKLKRMLLQFLRATKDEHLTLSAASPSESRISESVKRTLSCQNSRSHQPNQSTPQRSSNCNCAHRHLPCRSSLRLNGAPKTSFDQILMHHFQRKWVSKKLPSFLKKRAHIT
jgi:hypothetical protein